MNMRLFVTVKTRAKQESVEMSDKAHFLISVKALPIEGQANRAVQRLLARFLGVSTSALVLRSGASGKHKVFEMIEIS